MKLYEAVQLAVDEVSRATEKHGPMASAHEGYAVIKEELDELWDEVKAGNATTHRGVSEAVQVAAMAIRFLVDLCEDEAVEGHQRKIALAERISYSDVERVGYSG